MANLTSVPGDIVCSICLFLDFSDLSSIRQVSRTLRNHSLHALRRHIKTQRVHLSRPALQRLCDVSAFPDLKEGIVELQLILPNYNYIARNRDGNPLPQANPISQAVRQNWLIMSALAQAKFASEDMTSLLTEALSNLPALRSISLDAVVFDDVDHSDEPCYSQNLVWKNLWAQACRAHVRLLLSIVRSGVEIDSLSLYQGTRMCSLPSNEIHSALEQLDSTEYDILRTRLSLLTEFSISFSTPVLLNSRTNMLEGDSDLADPNHEKGVKAVARLLRLMPNLTSLHVHRYNASFDSVLLDPTRCSLSNLLHPQDFPKLQDVTLRGLRVTQKEMRDFLEAHPSLRHLRLERLSVASGSWDVVFAVVCRTQTPRRLRISGLWFPGGREQDENHNGRPRDNPPQIDWEGERPYDLGHGDMFTWATRDIDECDLTAGFNLDETRTGDAVWTTRNYLFEKHTLLEYGPPWRTLGRCTKSSGY